MEQWENLPRVPNFTGIIAHLSEFRLLSFMNDGGSHIFLKVCHIRVKNVKSGQGSVEISGDMKIRCSSIRKGLECGLHGNSLGAYIKGPSPTRTRP